MVEKDRAKHSIPDWIPRNKHLYFGIRRIRQSLFPKDAPNLTAESVQICVYSISVSHNPFHGKIIIKPFNCCGIHVYRTPLIYGHH